MFLSIHSGTLVLIAGRFPRKRAFFGSNYKTEHVQVALLGLKRHAVRTSVPCVLRSKSLPHLPQLDMVMNLYSIVHGEVHPILSFS